jgi:D-alanyl-lipoteichoic acid acyltransferase DltB (MBOAT superfamily)
VLFNSFSYALFLPLVFLLYWLPLFPKLRCVWQNGVLLLASYAFYSAWDWRFALLIAFTSLSSYWTALRMDAREGAARGRWAALNIAVNLGILAYFKYAGFFVDSFVALLTMLGWKGTPVALKVILPVGISFYTFQALGYTIDVYRRKIVPSRNPLRFFAFVSFFPQLVAGPIERAANLLPQFDQARRFDYAQAVRGVGLILWGLSLKLLLADRLAVYVDAAWKGVEGLSGLPALLAVLFFAFQLYADFYAYSEIARGSARLFGMELMLNFRRPYLSVSFKEFWKRWHISLSSWFGDYVYIPLGGNRKGAARRVMNVFIVFLLSGLWHGASWTFVAWGFLCALFMVLLDRPLGRIGGFRPLKIAIVFSLWALSLILFRAPDFGSALKMFSALGFDGFSELASFGLGRAELIFALSLLLLLAVQEGLWERRGELVAAKFYRLSPLLRVLCAVLVVLLLVLLGHYGIGNDSRFLYFQF